MDTLTDIILGFAVIALAWAIITVGSNYFRCKGRDE